MSRLSVTLIVLIALCLGAVIVPTVQSVRSKRIQIECTNNLKEVGKLLMVYGDNHKNFPRLHGQEPRPVRVQSLDDLRNVLPQMTELLFCPQDTEPGISYEFAPEDENVTLRCRVNHNGGRIVLYQDLRAVWVPLE